MGGTPHPKVGGIILARLDSTRLPKKHLRVVHGKPVLQHIVERARLVERLDSILVATTDRVVDDPLVDLCEDLGVDVFRGSVDDVAGRFLLAMESAQLDYGVRINGDNLFAVPTLIDRLVRIAVDEHMDFVSNMPDRTFPYGITVEVARCAWYRTVYERISSDEDREHVTRFIYREAPSGAMHYVRNTELPEASGLDLAIDTEADLEKAHKVMEVIGDSDQQYELESVVRVARQLEST